VHDANGRGIESEHVAIVALMAYGGLRRSEFVALDIADFDRGFDTTVHPRVMPAELAEALSAFDA
jgi:integrase